MIRYKKLWSDALLQEVPIIAYTPDDRKIRRNLVLLHGQSKSFETVSRLCEELELGKLSEVYGIFIVVPYISDNAYYISHDKIDYERFFGEELIEFMNCLNGEEVAIDISGVSMGAYGALLVGSRKNVFENILSISGAYIQNDVLLGNPEVWGKIRPTREETKGTFLYYFYPWNQLEDSVEKNAVVAAKTFLTQANKVVLTCGTQDWLYKRNLSLIKQLQLSDIPYDFIEIEGGEHENTVFKEGLWRAVESLYDY